MSKIEGGIKLVAIIDGTTINGYARVDNCPLVQRWTKGSNKFVPSFKDMAEKPTIIAIMREMATGRLLVPKKLTFSYNNTQLAFGPDGLCTTAGFEKKFKYLPNYAASVGEAQTVPMPAMEVVDDLVPISGYDNDRISVKGEVDIDGQAFPFNELSIPVTIEETTGSPYTIIVTNKKGSSLHSKDDSLEEVPLVYYNGEKMTDLSAFDFKWYKEGVGADVPLGTAQTQVIKATDVDNVLRIRVDMCKKGSSEVIKYGHDEITDFSDPYYVEIAITGINGDAVRRGQTATITPKAINRKTRAEEKNVVWTYNFADNGGNKIVKNAAGASCTVTYDEMRAAGFGMHIYIAGVL